MAHKEFELLNTCEINDNDIVKVTKSGQIIDIQKVLKKCNILQSYNKISQNEYVYIKTGEVFEYKHVENRSQSIANVKRSMKKLRNLINANFYGKDRKNELFITLTYKENMTDTKRLYKDFKKFWDRVKYFCKSKYSLEYIAVAEPQERGAWHLHILVKTNNINDTLFMAHEDIRKIWGLGTFIRVERLNEVDNVGAYLSAYLTNIETDTTNYDYEVKNKKIKKGARLYLYPTGMNIYRKSKGIVEPEIIKEIPYKDVITEFNLKNAKKTFKRTINIIDTDDNNKLLNSIYNEQYNLSRMVGDIV